MANPIANKPQFDQPPPNPSVKPVDPPPSIVLPDDQSTHSTSSNWSSRPIVPPGAGSSPGPPISKRHPSYRGIRSRNGKWVSEIREPGKATRIWLGTYPSPDMAAAAYDVAALALKGPDTSLNFPESIFSYPILAATFAGDIRTAAASAAAARAPKTENAAYVEACRPETEGVSSPGAATPPKQETGANFKAGRSETEGSSSGASAFITESGQEFIDEEALLNMPNLLVDMAEGMLLSPPRMNSWPSDDSPGNSDAESLWSYQYPARIARD